MAKIHQVKAEAESNRLKNASSIQSIREVSWMQASAFDCFGSMTHYTFCLLSMITELILECFGLFVYSPLNPIVLKNSLKYAVLKIGRQTHMQNLLTGETQEKVKGPTRC